MSIPSKPWALPIASVLDPRLSQVLEYWLGAELPTNASAQTRQALWFTKSEEVDEEIRHLFGAVLQEALAGKLDGEGLESPLGWLALLIVLDQFTRNAYRGTSKSFAGDAKALALALQGIDRGWDQDPSIPEMARIFVYLPLEHAESLAMQESSVVAFEELQRNAPPQLREFFQVTLDYAHKHREVIAQYGRFPHRNPILGRESTAAEKAYLSQPGAGF
ncbi:DUF924 family protein [Comamonas aquatica]|jgi:uncharacterized protein (DUF924 family)|uniref:Uncharacterized protein conserved in bacteria n=1 Tax=Comamonas aquatica TaxID=225991 RepID=A0AA35D921_9BURK|nr:DUF924 family protein [Comamonas aquatica]CAB5647793.1 Uncharacterized protein conserved in bacteria [Comamonas aquatica]CAB5696945.1 Uncharacterized protein conserved in bacteria [Comamonas aquatica]CAC9680965.1 Uncharacterized protein conserved in bacteria [Comamonas aquatica]